MYRVHDREELALPAPQESGGEEEPVHTSGKNSPVTNTRRLHHLMELKGFSSAGGVPLATEIMALI